MTFYILCDIKGQYKGYAILIRENNPLLIYCSRDAEYQPHQTQFWFKDTMHGDGYRGLKDHHPWEQGIGEAIHLIKGLTYESDLVVDPLIGSGTTALAARRLNRRFIGCDLKEEEVNTTLARLADE